VTLTDRAFQIPTAEPVRHRQIGLLLGATAVLSASAGLLTDSPLLVGFGLLVLLVAGSVAFVNDPTVLVLAFVAARGLLDLAPTYDLGPDLNAPAAAIVLIAVGRWFWTARDRLVTPSPSVWAAALFATAALASVPGSMTPNYSMTMALRVVIIVALFAFAEQRARLDPRFLTQLCGAILISAVAVSLVVIAQAAGLVPLPGADDLLPDPQAGRPPGPYLAAPVLATHVFLAIPVVLFLIIRTWGDRRLRFLTPHLFALGALLLWVMIENKSRGPLLGLAIAIAILLGVGRRWLAGAIAVALLLAGIALIPASAVRVEELGSSSDPGASADTIAWRVDYWERNLSRVSENPLTGIGMGRVEQVNLDGLPPHSTLVQTVVELGVFGLVAYVSLIATLLVDLVRVFRRSRGTTREFVALAALAVAFGYFFIGLFENLLTQVATSALAALFIGSVIGSSRADRPL